jgi:hypothetical protein
MMNKPSCNPTQNAPFHLADLAPELPQPRPLTDDFQNCGFICPSRCLCHYFQRILNRSTSRALRIAVPIGYSCFFDSVGRLHLRGRAYNRLHGFFRNVQNQMSVALLERH